MKNSTKIAECPKCGGKEVGKGKNSGHGAIYPEGTIILGVGSEVTHIICTDCGYIIETYVTRQDKFKSKRF